MASVKTPDTLVAAALGRTSTVVSLWGDVLDGGHFEASSGERTNRGVATRARSLDEHVDLAHAGILCPASSGFSSHLGGIRGRLTRTLEANLARRGPGHDRTAWVR